MSLEDGRLVHDVCVREAFDAGASGRLVVAVLNALGRNRGSRLLDLIDQSVGGIRVGCLRILEATEFRGHALEDFLLVAIDELHKDVVGQRQRLLAKQS